MSTCTWVQRTLPLFFAGCILCSSVEQSHAQAATSGKAEGGGYLGFDRNLYPGDQTLSTIRQRLHRQPSLFIMELELKTLSRQLPDHRLPLLNMPGTGYFIPLDDPCGVAAAITEQSSRSATRAHNKAEEFALSRIESQG